MTRHTKFYQRLDFALAHGLTEPQVYRMVRMRLVAATSGLSGDVLEFAGGLSPEQAVQTFTAICHAEGEATHDADESPVEDELSAAPRLRSCPTLWL